MIQILLILNSLKNHLGKAMLISEILTPEFIFTDLNFSSKEEAIIGLVDKLKNNRLIKDIEKIKQEVLEREKILSTGVGNGFAIPHTKTSYVEGFILLFARLNSSIDFQSHDGNSVDIIFLLIGQDSMVSEHIKLLSKISRLMNNDNFRNKIKESKSSNEIYELIKSEEK